jgi:regulator of protease activity HflC (stomatin/prohibitin superfamily)
MLIQALHRAGLRGWILHAMSLGAVALCLLLWQRAKTVDQDERGNAERRALFVGFWPPTLWLIGDSIERHERRRRRRFR